MLQTTLDAAKALFRTDPTIIPSERTRLLAILRNGLPKAPIELIPAPARIIRRGEAARRLGCSPRSVDRLATEGVLKKVKFPGRRRAVGFCERDIETLINHRGGQL